MSETKKSLFYTEVHNAYKREVEAQQRAAKTRAVCNFLTHVRLRAEAGEAGAVFSAGTVELGNYIRDYARELGFGVKEGEGCAVVVDWSEPPEPEIQLPKTFLKYEEAEACRKIRGGSIHPLRPEIYCYPQCAKGCKGGACHQWELRPTE